MLRKLFEAEGYTVSEAPDGEKGVKSYNENPTDLIITDLIMPEKEGIETIRELKKAYPDIKIIAMSGGGKNNPDVYLQIAKQIGAIEIFNKPIRTEELLKTVKKWISPR